MITNVQNESQVPAGIRFPQYLARNREGSHPGSFQVSVPVAHAISENTSLY